MKDYSKLISMIEQCSDITKLKNWITNAEREGAKNVADAARRRLIAVEISNSGEDTSDPMFLDFWKSIKALEFVLSDERGKTIRLSRTRQKIDREGVQKTLADLTLKATPSEGYFLLRDRGMLDMSAEAVVLRFRDRFSEDVVEAARKRLGSDDAPNA